MSWQPIETAPKDGTPIDIWTREFGRLIEVWWDEEDGWTISNMATPTHWMPLPEPPK